jgi:opacity protein-like surface antigen
MLGLVVSSRLSNVEVNMVGKTAIRRCSVLLNIVTLLWIGHPREAAAQGFVSPFIGYNFGGQSGCPQITNCSDKKTDWGVSFGALGSVVGFEAELGYTKNFFGESSAQSSDVLTFMGNVMLAPKFGPVQPYGVIGLGLLRTTVRATLLGTSGDQNQIGWDGGGGLIVFFTEHVGVRGDVRYFRSFQIVDLSNFPNIGIRQNKLDYGRVAAAAIFKF